MTAPAAGPPDRPAPDRPTASPPPAGIVLAAGAGSRYGFPKVRAVDEAGVPWVDRVVAALADAGCDPVFVMLGAAPDAPVPRGARTRVVRAWQSGLGATVRAGLEAAGETTAEMVVMVPVDVPDLPAAVVARALERARPAGTAALCRAVFAGDPGHPVVLGRSHWAAAAAAASGDRGAGPYLSAHGAIEIECADLWHGHDIDRAGVRPAPEAAAWRR